MMWHPLVLAVSLLAPLDSAKAWINGPVSASALARHVVVVDIFTVDCSNCQNVVPTLRALYANDRPRGRPSSSSIGAANCARYSSATHRTTTFAPPWSHC